MDDYEYSEALAAAVKAETGTCDSCEVLMINGVRCHEHGCPRYAKLHRLRLQSEARDA